MNRGGPPRPATAVDARLSPAIAAAVARGDTLWLIEHPRALPPPGSPPADWVALPLAFAWLYPDSMVVADALELARLGLLLEGEWRAHEEPEAALRRLVALLAGFELDPALARADRPPLDLRDAGARAQAVPLLSANCLVIARRRSPR